MRRSPSWSSPRCSSPTSSRCSPARSDPPLHDGLVLFALVVVQFWISPEVLVICALFAVLALIAVVVAVLVARRRHVPQLLAQSRHGTLALLVGAGLSIAVLAYPVWFGLAGPQAVSGLLFPFAPIAGAVLWQYFSTAGAAALDQHRAADRLPRAQRSAGELHGVG